MPFRPPTLLPGPRNLQAQTFWLPSHTVSKVLEPYKNSDLLTGWVFNMIHKWISSLSFCWQSFVDCFVIFILILICRSVPFSKGIEMDSLFGDGIWKKKTIYISYNFFRPSCSVSSLRKSYDSYMTHNYLRFCDHCWTNNWFCLIAPNSSYTNNWTWWSDKSHNLTGSYFRNLWCS